MHISQKLLQLSLEIKQIVVEELRHFPANGIYLLESEGDNLKGKHHADEQVYLALSKYFAKAHLPADIYIESGAPLHCSGEAEFCVFIDPVDGSLNRDLGVGDPGVIIAYASGNKPRFKEIFAGYAYGLYSGDTYYGSHGKAYYQPRDASVAREIRCDRSVTRLCDAILYYNDGYGRAFARHSFRKAGILPFLVKHRNAFDNSGLEICQMCRGAAHLRVEARAYAAPDGMKGSDHANILAAFAMGKGAGLLVADLQGNALDDITIEVDAIQDFICATHEALLRETIDILARNQALLAQLVVEGTGL